MIGSREWRSRKFSTAKKATPAGGMGMMVSRRLPGPISTPPRAVDARPGGADWQPICRSGQLKCGGPGPYVARRPVILEARLSVVRRDGLDVCVKH